MNDMSSNTVPTMMPSSSQAQAQQPEQYQPTSPPPQQPPPPIPTAQEVSSTHPATTTMGVVSNPHSQFTMPTTGSTGNIDPRYNRTGSMTSPSYQHQQQQQTQPQYQQPQQMQQPPYGNVNPAQPWQPPPPNVATNSYGYPQQQQQQQQQQPYPSSTYPPMQQAYLQSNQQQQQQHGSHQPNPNMPYPQLQPPYFNGNMNGVQYNTQQQQQQVPQQFAASSASAASPGMSNWNQNSMNPSGMNAFVGTNSAMYQQSNTNQNAVGRYSNASSTASVTPYSNHIHYNNNHSSTASVSTTGSISTNTKTGMRRPPYVDPNTNILYDVNDPDYEGWLYKQSQWLKEWRKRYFILKGSNLFFCKHPTSGAPHGMMDLSICTTVKSADDKSGKFHSFEISTPDTCYLLHAETESEKDDWIGRVGKAIVRCSRTYYKGDGSNNKNANTTRNYPNNSNNNRQENEDDDDDDIYENDDPDSPYFND